LNQSGLVLLTTLVLLLVGGALVYLFIPAPEDDGLDLHISNRQIRDFQPIEKSATAHCYSTKDPLNTEPRTVTLYSKASIAGVSRGEGLEIWRSELNDATILRLHEILPHAKINNLYLITDPYEHADLIADINLHTANYLTEDEAKPIMRRILQAVQYLHSLDLTHGSIDANSFVWQEEGVPIHNPDTLTLHGGLERLQRCSAEEFVSIANLDKQYVPLPKYSAPQMLGQATNVPWSGLYSQSADLWSCGVVMYFLLCGYTPFAGSGDSEDDVIRKVRLANYQFKHDDFGKVSDEAKQLMRCLLKLHPSDRLTAKQALGHSWLATC